MKSVARIILRKPWILRYTKKNKINIFTDAKQLRFLHVVSVFFSVNCDNEIVNTIDEVCLFLFSCSLFSLESLSLELCYLKSVWPVRSICSQAHEFSELILARMALLLDQSRPRYIFPNIF